MRRSREDMFEILVREHESALFVFARACVGDAALAEDIVQETFLVAWKKFQEYDKEHPFSAWLRGIASNKIAEHSRNRAIAGKHVRIIAPEALESISHEVGRLISGRGDVFPQTVEALRRCLASALSLTDQRIVERWYRGGEACSALARDFGQTSEGLRKRLQRARAALKACIELKLRQEAIHA